MFNDRDLGILGAGALLAVLCLFLPFSFVGKVVTGFLVLVGFMALALLRLGPDRVPPEVWLMRRFRYSMQTRQYVNQQTASRRPEGVPAADKVAEGKSPLSVSEAVNLANRAIPDGAFDIHEAEMTGQGGSGAIEIAAYSDSEARKQWEQIRPKGAELVTLMCDVSPTYPFLGKRKPGIWKAYWTSYFRARIAYRMAAQVIVRYHE